MNRALAFLVISVALVGLLLAGCTQAAPAPTQAKPAAAPTTALAPTSAPAPAPTALPTKAADPTKPAAAPTTAAAAPAKKVDFPSGGKPITLMVPWAAGGLVDIGARLLAPSLEKELGTPVQVVNKAGAASQIALTEVSGAKPDGYTISYFVLPTIAVTYLDADRKASYTRASFQPIAQHYRSATTIAVRADSPYKTFKDLIEAAKANPEKIKVGTSGVQGTPHLAVLQTSKATGVRFAAVHFEGGGPALTALLGGHIDAQFEGISTHVPPAKSGQVRVLAISDRERSPYLPDVPTIKELGYDVLVTSAQGILGPAGIPKDVVDLLSNTIKKVVESDEHRKKLVELGYTLDYRNPEQYAALWSEFESWVGPLIPLSKE